MGLSFCYKKPPGNKVKAHIDGMVTFGAWCN